MRTGSSISALLFEFLLAAAEVESPFSGGIVRPSTRILWIPRRISSFSRGLLTLSRACISTINIPHKQSSKKAELANKNALAKEPEQTKSPKQKSS